MSQHTIKQDLDSIERDRAHFQKYHPSINFTKWGVPLSTLMTKEDYEAGIEAKASASDTEYYRNYHVRYPNEIPEAEVEADIEANVERRRVYRIKARAKEIAFWTPQPIEELVELNFEPIYPLSDKPEVELRHDPEVVLKYLKQLKLTNKTVEDVLKTMPKAAMVKPEFDETHRVLQLVCEDPTNITRIALDGEDKPKYSLTYNHNLGYTPGTFMNILKGVADGQS